MAAARMAGIVLALVPALLAAQQPAQGHLSIHVVDPTGAANAGDDAGRPSIEIDPANPLPSLPVSSLPVRGFPDKHGDATFDLAAGNYVLFVDSCSFGLWTQKISIKADSVQSVVAKFRVGSFRESPCVARVTSGIAPKSDVIDISIPAEPVKTMSLASIAIRRRFR